MKKLTFLFALVSSGNFLLSQTPHAIWNDQVNNNYKYVQLNSATGIKTNISTLPPISGFIAGDVSAINTDSNYYYFAGQVNTNKVLFTLDLTTGTLKTSVVMSPTVVGVEYNCMDSTLYGIQVSGNTYNFVKLDPWTATTTSIGSIPNITGYVGGTFSLDLAQQIYTFRVLTNGGYRLKSINVKTGAIIYDNPFPDNVVGHKFSPTDQSIYGLWDDNNGGPYKLEKINYVNGTHTTVNSLAGVTPGFVVESQSMNQNGGYTFRGFNLTNKYTIFTFDAATATLQDSASTSDNAVGFEEPVCFSGTTSIKNNSAPFTVNIYPNPSNGDFTVTINTNEAKICMYDVCENLILSEEIKSGKTSIITENLCAGIYTVQIFSSQTILHQQLLITK